jgi:hypothetical protein
MESTNWTIRENYTAYNYALYDRSRNNDNNYCTICANFYDRSNT